MNGTAVMTALACLAWQRADYVCRLLNHMRDRAYSTVTPKMPSEALPRRPFLDLKSGYVQRAEHLMPKQVDRHPWQLHQNYFKDMKELRGANFDDGVLSFEKFPAPTAKAERAKEPA